jgi:hypothetical protein
MRYPLHRPRRHPDYPLSGHVPFGVRQAMFGSHAIEYWQERLSLGNRITYRRTYNARGDDVQRARALLAADLL